MAVYALYNRTRRIGLILLSVFLVENLTQAFSMSISIPTLPFHEFCLVKRIPTSVLYFGYALYPGCQSDCRTDVYDYSSSTVLTQIVILGLTLVKHSFARREGWGRTPVVSLVLRDGSYVFFIVSGEPRSAPRFLDIACVIW